MCGAKSLSCSREFAGEIRCTAICQESFMCFIIVGCKLFDDMVNLLVGSLYSSATIGWWFFVD